MAHLRNNRSPQSARYSRIVQLDQEFTCVNCGLHVIFAPHIAGVQNRNHCPYCLWSRHLDWRNAGDRLSNCRAAMAPIGLTTKHGRNRYARERDGELMLIHRCSACAALAINRIAADDSTETLFEVFEGSLEAGPALRAELVVGGIVMLGAAERGLLRRRLLGGR